MLRQGLRIFIVAVVLFAIWKLFDGDLGAALSSILDTVMGWVDSAANWLSGLPIFQSIFG